MFMFDKRLSLSAAVLIAFAGVAAAQPSSVEHTPANQTFSQPSGITQREPEVPRDGETVDLFFRVSFQFTYDRVCVYYTTDGSEPSGAFGTGTGTTQVLRNDLGGVSFLVNENSGGTRDWWRATLPVATRAYAKNIKYKISAWKPFVGGEVFANGGASYAYTNKLAWPGAGAGNPSPAIGYPGVNFWKEEAIFGNTYTAGMIDRNGTVYDMHFPTPGGVYGVGTRNEGYVDGIDTFPAGLPLGWRGQMHLNQAMPGVRVDGTTHWLSNVNGASYDNITQAYEPNSNTIITSQRLYASGNNIAVTQYDFSPIGVSWPTDGGGNPQRHIYLKRLVLTNNGASSKDVDVYWYIDPAINGGDTYDGMFVDSSKAAMVAFDNTFRVVTGTGTGFTSPNEYNPTTSGGYEKNKSLYLASAMKVLTNSGSIASTATDFWRDTSGDNGQGWMGTRVTLPVGQPVEVDFIMAGAVDNFAGASGTYNFQLQNVMEWFYNNSITSLMTQTDNHWQAWLNNGTTVDTPDNDYDALMKRGLLATALHVDGVNGGVIAGFHNGAYPYVWPRDAVYAAVTLARTGHLAEAEGVYAWMKNTTYRDFEGWGRKGFWKQKYSTDGYVIWGAPQIDETAVFPWGVWYQYQMTADTSLLSNYIEQVRDSVETMTRTSTIDPGRLQFTPFNLVYSNNVWEDSYDTFIYSNANVWRGLEDARKIFDAVGSPGEAFNAFNKRNLIKSGLDARLDWNGENTDVSQLGITYPFEVYNPLDARVNKVVDRINGVATDRFGNNHPLINFSGEHQDTVNRYWGDSYWNGGPWFLSTLWYGLHYATRADFTAGKGDIDNHKYRVDLMIDRLGPAGMGAEQIAYANSYLYPGQSDFTLQTAWPNAWESMSTFVDSVMAFLDYSPDAPSNTMRFKPKLPTAWTSMQFNNVVLKVAPANFFHKMDVLVEENAAAQRYTHTFTMRSENPLNLETVVRVPSGSTVYSVTRNGTPVFYTHDSAIGAVTVGVPANVGLGAQTIVEVRLGCPPDFNNDGFLDFTDFDAFVAAFEAGDNAADYNGDGFLDFTDFDAFVAAFETGC